jgi:serine/threonine protein kinase
VNCEEYGGRYHDPNVLGKVQTDSNTAIKNALINAKDFKGFQVGRTDKDKKKPPQVIDIPNDFLKQAIANLRPLSPEEADYLEYTEQRRLVQAKTTFALNGLTDMAMSMDTGLGPLRPSPEPEKFDAELVFDGALGNKQELPDDIPFSVAQDLVTFVKSKMAGVVKNLPSDSDGLIDLFLMSKEDLARMANKALTGVDSPKGISQSHDIMLKQIADEMRKAISENAPNKVSGDKSEMTIGNDKWKLVKTLGAGAGGTAMLYCKEDNPSETIVVKMPNPINEYGDPYMGDQYSELTDEEKKAAAIRGREAMAKEMRTHHRLSKDNKGQDKSDNLLDMSGAAIGPDGELFMVMETAAGGDMAGLGLNMSVVQNLGIIPPEARSALARDLIVQTIKGMKALEQRGLIHNDLKPENILMSEDGTLKIMDFGESRFGDDEGKTDNVITAQEGDAPFRVTPGFDGEEQYKRGGKIDSRSDVFALGIVAKLFSKDEYSSSDIKKDVTDKTAMGKLIAAATSKNVDDRPSLESLLASSVLSANEEEYSGDMVADLRKAMVKFGMTMSAAKAPVDMGEIPPPTPWNERPSKPGEDPQLSEKKAKMAEEWDTKVLVEMRKMLDRELNPDKDESNPNPPAKNYSLGDLQSISKAIGNSLKDMQFRVRTASVENRDLYKSQLEAAEKAILWLQTKMKEMTEATTLAGQEEFDILCEDPNQKLTVPGEGGGEMTVGEAVKLRDERILQLQTLQQDFYQFANDHPELAAKELTATNIKLIAMKDQLQFVNDAVFKILGPKGKFMVAQKELAEATIGFGA